MAVYRINGDKIGDLNESEVKAYTFLAYNVGNFADGGSHGGYSGDDLEGWITNWVRFFGGQNADACLLTESRTYVDSGSTELSKDRIYLPTYKNVSNYNPSVSWGAALLTNETQYGVQSGMFANRISAESKYICATIKLNSVELLIVATHLNNTVTGREQDSVNVRALQMAELITLTSNYDNVIIGGDFNVNAISEMTPFINAGYTLSNGGVFGEFNTWSEDNPIYPLDHICIKGEKLRLKDFKVFKGVTSRDHLATMATILIG